MRERAADVKLGDEEPEPFSAVSKPLRAESRQAVLAAIGALSLSESAKLYGEGTGKTVSDVLAKLWNDLIDLTGLPAKYRAKANETAYEFLRRMGVSKKLADLAVAHLPDLIGDAASKLPIPGSGAIVRAAVKKLLQKIASRQAT
jgi:hypothetical protein